MVTTDTPKSATATKVVLCGSDELGKGFVTELQRYGVGVITLDKYLDAPAIQMTHRSYVVSILDGGALREIVEKEKPDHVVPEVETIVARTPTEPEGEEYHVIPTARTTQLTMNREGTRHLAAEELGLSTSPHRFVETEGKLREAVKVIDASYVVKPIVNSSGHGQSVAREEKDTDRAQWYAQEEERAGAGRVIVEGFVDFDYEITQLAVRHIGGASFLGLVGHVRADDDCRKSWQPQATSLAARAKAREIVDKVTEALGGRGIFDAELLVKGDDVIFSEVSLRPHDIGMVTMIMQDLSQFALHTRAVPSLPTPSTVFHGAGTSRAIVVEEDSDRLSLGNLDKALEQPDTQMRFFGKPEVHGHHRVVVLLAHGLDVTETRGKTGAVMGRLNVKL